MGRRKARRLYLTEKRCFFLCWAAAAILTTRAVAPETMRSCRWQARRRWWGIMLVCQSASRRISEFAHFRYRNVERSQSSLHDISAYWATKSESSRQGLAGSFQIKKVVDVYCARDRPVKNIILFIWWSDNFWMYSTEQCNLNRLHYFNSFLKYLVPYPSRRPVKLPSLSRCQVVPIDFLKRP